MSDLSIKENQAALLLEEDEEGEISVQVVQSSRTEPPNLPGDLCQVMARKLIEDEQFQSLVLAGLDETDERREGTLMILCNSISAFSE